jgi:hypothetical protein
MGARDVTNLGFPKATWLCENRGRNYTIGAELVATGASPVPAAASPGIAVSMSFFLHMLQFRISKEN